MIIFYFLILVMPLTQHPLWSRFVGDLTGIKYIGVTCLPYAFFHVLTNGGRPPSLFRTWQARLFLFIFILSTISYWTIGRRLAWYMSHSATYMSLVILF